MKNYHVNFECNYNINRLIHLTEMYIAITAAKDNAVHACEFDVGAALRKQQVDLAERYPFLKEIVEVKPPQVVSSVEMTDAELAS